MEDKIELLNINFENYNTSNLFDTILANVDHTFLLNHLDNLKKLLKSEGNLIISGFKKNMQNNILNLYGEFFNILEITEENQNEPRFIYGIVDEMKKSLEGTDFASDAELYPNKLPSRLAEIAHVSVLRVEPQIFNPPTPGLAVYKATDNKFKEALYEDVMDRTFVLGHTRTGLAQEEVIHGNLDFLDGESGAHVNISGISGVATKTSYATFLLHSIFSSLEQHE